MAKNLLIIVLIIATIGAGIWLVANLLHWRTKIIADPVIEAPTTEFPPGDEPNQKVEPIGQIPILMYHVIGDGSGSLQELYVNPGVFASQMEYLQANGYHTITMSELYDHWQEGTPLPARPIILTFDDGYRSDYELAFPILQANGFRAVHFLYVRKQLNHANSLTREEIAELLAAGHEIGNHTYNHIELHTAGPQGLVKETQQAKTALEGILDIQIVSFCYPVGRYNSDAIRAVEESGHRLAVTTEYGYASAEQGLLTLKRIRINRSDELQGFIQKLKRYEEIEPTR